ncbi:hypothetical protein L499_A2623 [Bordetella holmesii CDC-H635-BH]|nr:hypothetical protein L499_A2623 [Bordetella holmesii CDC-H635-BH]
MDLGRVPGAGGRLCGLFPLHADGQGHVGRGGQPPGRPSSGHQYLAHSHAVVRPGSRTERGGGRDGRAHHHHGLRSGSDVGHEGFRRRHAGWTRQWRGRGSRRSLVGLLEAFMAGYVSSAYKDAVPFVLIIVILLVMPQGLFGKRSSERV